MYKKLILFLVVVASSAAYGAKISLRRDGLIEQPGNFCQGCRSIVSYVSRFNSTSNRAEYKDLFKNFCETSYPVSTDYRQGPCPVFVEGLFYVFDKIDPVYHCDQIGACESSSLVATTTYSDNNLPERNGNVVCNVCEQLVQQVQGELEDPKIIDGFKQQIDQFCDFLKVVDEDKECKRIINKYMDMGIDFVRHLDPLKYCQSIQLCTTKQISQKKTQLPTLADFNDFGIETSVIIGNKVVKDISNNNYQVGPACMFCKRFVKEMFNFLRENRTEANIRVGLDKICSLVFRSGHNFEQCEEMVEAYSKELIEILVDETDPEIICMLLEQCTYQVEQPISAPQPIRTFKPEPIDMGDFISMLDSSVQVGSMKTCVECKLFIQYLQNALDDPKSEDEVKNWLLSNLCDSLPEQQLKDSCKDLVTQYSNVFFKAIAEQLNPQNTCADLGACRRKLKKLWSPLSSVELFPTNKQVEEPKKLETMLGVRNQLCDQCVEIVSKIDDYLSTHSIDHDVNVLVDEVCNKIPDNGIKAECTFLVKNLGQNIAEVVANMDNPRQLCHTISLC